MSPHPDDDVISMGGTLTRLLGQGHEVHVAYQTSGNIAVWDEDALRFADFAVQVGGWGCGRRQQLIGPCALRDCTPVQACLCILARMFVCRCAKDSLVVAA
jgi:hypothetical protein